MSKSKYAVTKTAGGLGVTLMASLKSELNKTGTGTFIDPVLASSAIAMESMDDLTTSRLESAQENFNIALESMLSSAGLKSKFSPVQLESGRMAAVMASNLAASLQAEAPAHNGNGQFIAPTASALSIATESYDNVENRNAPLYTVSYNLQAPQQNEFGETLFPTTIVAPDQAGFQIGINLVHLVDQIRRSANGELANYNRRNVVYAHRDPSILRNDAIKVVPVYRASSAAMFIDAAVLAPSTTVINGEAVSTSALLMDKTVSLLGLAQTDAMLAVATHDNTEQLDAAIRLKNLYMQVGGAASTEVVKFDVSQSFGAVFNAAPQGDSRAMQVNIDAKLNINKGTKLASGGALVALQPVVTGDFMVRLAVRVSGGVNLDFSDTNLMAGEVSVVSVTDSAGVVHAPTSAIVSGIVALFADAKVVAYDLLAQRTNTNRRFIAQMLDTRKHVQTYGVPLHAPFTIQRPQMVTDLTDATDVSALVQVTHALISNSAVATLQEAAAVLARVVDKRNSMHDVLDVMGVSRHILTPFYEHMEIDVEALMNSITSHDRVADAQATIVNGLRDSIYRAHRDSGYQVAADAVAGGIAPRTTVIIATDPLIERYLLINGDLRTLGEKFDVKIVSSNNVEMFGKLYMTFGQFGAGMEGIPNPMHFGNLAIKPSQVVILPTHRNGANHKELTVQPCFLHVVNLPILLEFDVKNITEAMVQKTAIDFREVV